MAFQFTKAVKSKCKARVALFGPSGSGKTFTALRVAKGMGGTIAVIDTEFGSASKYADRFEFDTLALEQATIESLCAAIDAAKSYSVLIIDSMSHAWQELIQEVETLAKQKYKGNTFSAWSEGTPKQKRLIRALLSFPGHVIATMRVKTEWVEQEDRGRKKYVRQGLNPEQGKGIEYEFDLLLSLTVDHVGTVEKDRTGKYQDQIIDKPGEDFGKSLAEWLSEGVAPPKPDPKADPQKTDFAKFTAALLAAETCDAVRKLVGVIDKKDATLEDKDVMYGEAFKRYLSLEGPEVQWAKSKLDGLRRGGLITEKTMFALAVELEKLDSVAV